MRRRCSNNDLSEVERPSGALKEDEIEEIRQAYRDGCKGEILIGLRGEERVITMLLPVQVSLEANNTVMERSQERLRAMRCDWCIRIRRRL